MRHWPGIFLSAMLLIGCPPPALVRDYPNLGPADETGAPQGVRVFVLRPRDVRRACDWEYCQLPDTPQYAYEECDRWDNGEKKYQHGRGTTGCFDETETGPWLIYQSNMRPWVIEHEFCHLDVAMSQVLAADGLARARRHSECRAIRPLMTQEEALEKYGRKARGE